MIHRYTLRPQWAIDFHRQHGVWPISGGSSDITVTGAPPSTTTGSNNGSNGDLPQGVQADQASGFPTAQPTQPPSAPAAEKPLPPRDPETGRFTKDDIEKARKEEKDKLYGEIERVKEQLRVFEEERQARLQAEEEARKAQEEEAEAKRREETDLKTLLQETNQTWEQRFAQVQAEREAERELLNKEREFIALQQYRQQAIEANLDDILPELHDLIQGNTQEEIDAAVASMKERTERILNQVTAAAGQQRMQMRGTSVTAPPVGPPDNDSALQTMSAQELRAMDMQTYMKNRDRLLAAVTQRVGEQGLYD